MDIAGMLAQSGALDSVAREYGIDPATASAGAAALLPAIMGGFKQQAQGPAGGLDGLGAMLGQLGGGGLLDAVVGPQATPVEQGNSILGTIFGSKDVSRQVASAASAQSGINADTLKKLLPVVAMLAAGYMATQRGARPTGSATSPVPDAGAGGMGGMLGQVLGSVLGGGRGAAPEGQTGRKVGGLAGMLDIDGDGNPLNDLMGMAARIKR